MENKEDVINSSSFENLKSYTIFRRRAPPIHNSADIVLAQTSVIRNWHFKLVSSTSSRYWFVLYGTVNNSFIKSSLVTDVVEDVVRTENSFYKLCGNMSAKCDPHRHFNKELLKQFQHGFPPNWRNLLESEIRRIVALEGSHTAKEDANVAPREPNKNKDEHLSGKSENMQDREDVKCNIRQDKHKISEEGHHGSGEARPLDITNNTAKARLSLEKRLIAQKTAEMLSSDDESDPLIQEGPSSDLKNDGKKRERRRTVNEFVHRLEKGSGKQDDVGEEASVVGDGMSSAMSGEPLKETNDDGARLQVAVVKKRVSFNTEDIQEIILDGKNDGKEAEEDVPDVPMDRVAGAEPEKSEEVATCEDTDNTLQIQAVAQPRRRGRAKSLSSTDKQYTAKSGDERKTGARKRRRRLTMPTGFKA